MLVCLEMAESGSWIEEFVRCGHDDGDGWRIRAKGRGEMSEGWEQAPGLERKT